MSNPSAEQRFGTLVKSLRTATGMSQRAVAAEMVDRGHAAWVQSTVGRTESGTRPLRLAEFLSMCQVLDYDPEQALRDVIEVAASPSEVRVIELEAEARRLRDESLVVEAHLAELRAAEQDRVNDIASLRNLEDGDAAWVM